MSISGCLYFYSTTKPLDASGYINKVLDYLLPKKILYLYRSLKEDQSWNDFKKEIYIDSFENENLKIPQEVNDIASLYITGRTLSMALSMHRIGEAVFDIVEKKIINDVRGDYIPSDIGLMFGYHDLFYLDENDNGVFVARPFFSLSIFGYNVPNDIEAFREQVFALEEIQKIKKELEQVTGPLGECAIWDV